MKNFNAIANLSVVFHNNLLVQRKDEATEAARLAFVTALATEQEALLNASCEPTKANKTTLAKARKAAIVKACRYFARKQIDDTLAPLFWVKG